jgi:HK97 family phage prohead protease
MTTFILSDTSKTNSHGFRIAMEGMDTSRFRENPVMLYRHNDDDVIGRWHNLRVDDGRLLADAEFDQDDELAAKVAGKVERGFIKGCSMGICIKDMQETADGWIATKSELMEASICSIPSDAGAVTLYDIDRRQLTIDEVKLQFSINDKKLTKEEMEVNNENLAQELAAKDNEIAALKAQLAEQKEKEIDSFLSAAVKEGKITEESKSGYALLAADNFDTVKKVIDGKKAEPEDKRVSLAAMVGKQASKYDGKTWDELDRAGMLAALRAEVPEKYAELYKQKFNV